jgi:hypothetical protein
MTRHVSSGAGVAVTRGRAAAPVVIPGVVVGLLAVLAFGAVHAWLVVPIWSRLVGGLPLAVAAAAALAWAFDRAADRRGWRTTQGFLFGVYMFGTLIPATAVDVAMRLNGLRLGDTAAGTAVGAAIFVLSGVTAGWIATREKSTALVFGLATIALMAVAGGPLPVTRSARGAWLSGGIACITAAAGASIALLRSMVRRRLRLSEGA